MKNHYLIRATKMTNTCQVSVSLHDGARLNKANPAFMPQQPTDNARERSCRAAIKNVPFMLIANETNGNIATLGRPYIPAGTLRGMLRSASTLLFMSGLQVDHSVLSKMVSGGRIAKGDRKKEREAAKGKADKAEKTDEDAAEKKTGSNPGVMDLIDLGWGLPHFELFGLNSPSFKKGFDSFGHLVSKGMFILTPTGSVRQLPSNQTPELLNNLAPQGMVDFEEDLAAQNKQVDKNAVMEQKIRDATRVFHEAESNGASVDEREKLRKKIADAYEAKDRAKDGTDPSQQQLHGGWAIPINVDFDFSLSHTISDEAFGLLVLLLRNWSHRDCGGRIGGNKGRGGGANYDLTFSVQKWDGEKYCEMGTISNCEDEKSPENLDGAVKLFLSKMPLYKQIIGTLK